MRGARVGGWVVFWKELLAGHRPRATSALGLTLLRGRLNTMRWRRWSMTPATHEDDASNVNKTAKQHRTDTIDARDSQSAVRTTLNVFLFFFFFSPLHIRLPADLWAQCSLIQSCKAWSMRTSYQSQGAPKKQQRAVFILLARKKDVKRSFIRHDGRARVWRAPREQSTWWRRRRFSYLLEKKMQTIRWHHHHCSVVLTHASPLFSSSWRLSARRRRHPFDYWRYFWQENGIAGPTEWPTLMGSDGCASLATTSRLLCLLSQQSVFVFLSIRKVTNDNQTEKKRVGRWNEQWSQIVWPLNNVSVCGF